MQTPVFQLRLVPFKKLQLRLYIFFNFVYSLNNIKQALDKSRNYHDVITITHFLKNSRTQLLYYQALFICICMVYITPKHKLTLLLSLFHFSRNWNDILSPAPVRQKSPELQQVFGLRCTALPTVLLTLIKMAKGTKFNTNKSIEFCFKERTRC